jgi:hypothetical protein
MSSSRGARGSAIVFGTLAVAAIPAAAAASVVLSEVKILHALLVAVPAGFLFGLCGISASRRARFKIERSVHRVGERSLKLGRTLVFAGLYAAVVGGLALGFYGLLRAAS